MLVEFSVGNYLSFKNVVTFSLVASGIKEHKDTHLFETKKLKLLKSAVVYGANASGKSNLFSAMAFMTEFVLNSSKGYQIGEKIDVESFRLSTETINKPSFFEIVLVQNNVLYRYGFEVNKLEVVREWLYFTPKNQEIQLFERNGSTYSISDHFKEGKNLFEKTRNNALFVSVVSQFNGEIATSIVKWFGDLFNISGLTDSYRDITTSILENKNLKNTFINLIRMADSGIEDVKIKNKIKLGFEIVPGKNEEWQFDHTVTNISTFHKKYSPNNKFIELEEFQLTKHESRGTEKLFSLLGPIIDTLQKGSILIVDEFDSRLHTLLTRFIVGLFNSVDKNPNNAQLIINTHDTNLLSRKIFRRDQIWFAEKDRYGATDLYSLVEYQKVRNDSSFEKDYLIGKYGAIPFVGDLDFNINQEDTK